MNQAAQTLGAAAPVDWARQALVASSSAYCLPVTPSSCTPVLPLPSAPPTEHPVCCGSSGQNYLGQPLFACCPAGSTNAEPGNASQISVELGNAGLSNAGLNNAGLGHTGLNNAGLGNAGLNNPERAYSLQQGTDHNPCTVVGTFCISTTVVVEAAAPPHQIPPQPPAQPQPAAPPPAMNGPNLIYPPTYNHHFQKWVSNTMKIKKGNSNQPNLLVSLINAKKKRK